MTLAGEITDSGFRENFLVLIHPFCRVLLEFESKEQASRTRQEVVLVPEYQLDCCKGHGLGEGHGLGACFSSR